MSRFPSDAFLHELIRPNMETGQRFQLLSVVDAQNISDLSPSSEGHGIAVDRNVVLYQVLKFGFQQLARFVKVSRVEQETSMRHLEVPISLANATFSQEEQLIARRERANSGRPLFQGDV